MGNNGSVQSTIDTLSRYYYEKMENARRHETAGNRKCAADEYQKAFRTAENIESQSIRANHRQFWDNEREKIKEKLKFLKQDRNRETGSEEIIFDPEEFLVNTESFQSDTLIGIDHILEDMVFMLSLAVAAGDNRRLMKGMRPSFLLAGEPGTGKTSSALKIAQVTGLPLFYARYSDFMSEYFGVTVRRISAFFEMIRRHARRTGLPGIFFLDEGDGLIGSDREGRQVDERIRATFRMEMEGIDRDRKPLVFVMVATNVPWRIPENQTDKFGRIYVFDKPKDTGVRFNILKSRLTDENFIIAPDVDLYNVAEVMENASGRDLDKLAFNASYRMIRRHNPGLACLNPQSRPADLTKYVVSEGEINSGDVDESTMEILNEISVREATQWQKWTRKFRRKIIR